MCERDDSEGLVERLTAQVRRAGHASNIDPEEHARGIAAEVERAMDAAENRRALRSAAGWLLPSMRDLQ